MCVKRYKNYLNEFNSHEEIDPYGEDDWGENVEYNYKKWKKNNPNRDVFDFLIQLNNREMEYLIEVFKNSTSQDRSLIIIDRICKILAENFTVEISLANHFRLISLINKQYDEKFNKKK